MVYSEYEDNMVPRWQLPQESHCDYDLRARLVVNNRPNERSPVTNVKPKKEKKSWK